MIQRIQSVYLLLTAILMAVTIFSPFIILPSQTCVFLLNGLCVYTNDIPSNINFLLWIGAAISAISALLALINIMRFKNRKKQIAGCKIITFLIVLLYIVLAIYFFSIRESISNEFSSLKYGVILPLIALVFNVLATSKIRADEKLVQSLNRIR